VSLTKRPVLVADDEETDRFILKLAFDSAKLPNPMLMIRDGKEVVDYLSGRAVHGPGDSSFARAATARPQNVAHGRIRGFILARHATRLQKSTCRRALVVI
jgi:hypothetical protein